MWSTGRVKEFGQRVTSQIVQVASALVIRVEFKVVVGVVVVVINAVVVYQLLL